MRTKTNFLLLTLAIALLPFKTIYAQNLLEIYKLAEQNDPAIMAAEANMLATREAKPQSVANLLPNISISADSYAVDQDIKGVGSDGYNNHGYTLSLTQPLFRFDYFVQLKQADATVGRANAEYLAAQHELMIRVAEAYFNVLGAMDNLRFTQQEKLAVGRQLEQAQQRFEVGIIAITDVHEAKAAYDQATAQEILAENLLDSTREALQAITGQTHEQLSVLKEEIPLLHPDPEDMQQWVKTAEEQNPNILAARFASEEARQGINVARSGHLPTLDLVASSTHNNTGSVVTGDLETDTDRIGVELNMSLFQGGRVMSQTREASYQFQAASHNLEQEHRLVTRQTRDQYRTVIANISSVEAFKQAVISNKSALEATEAGYEVGTRTIVDVLATQRNLYEVERDHARARYTYLLSTLRLKQAAGILQSSDIQTINSWLN